MLGKLKEDGDTRSEGAGREELNCWKWRKRNIKGQGKNSEEVGQEDIVGKRLQQKVAVEGTEKEVSRNGDKQQKQ